MLAREISNKFDKSDSISPGYPLTEPLTEDDK